MDDQTNQNTNSLNKMSKHIQAEPTMEESKDSSKENESLEQVLTNKASELIIQQEGASEQLNKS